MYLHYNVEPHFLKEKFEIFHPVGSIAESDSFAKQLMQKQDQGKTYSDFCLMDMSKEKVLKPYSIDELAKKPRVIKERGNERGMKL
ncbi:hypothetical protein [Filimonas effusa]|uniref:Uncharacterized protein n=1 Tax=Filimonas effusa TaxID=2508721 RepID=A0A4Q1D3I8_9BACT|nr:hypothetical protein [Filimonas effusa]RXK81697.1 hypothetical protein ESB13_18040 [Filimonas effusa]